MQAVRSIPAAALAPRVNNNNTARRPSTGIVSLRRRTGAVVPAASAEKDGAKVDYRSDEFTVLPDAPVKDLVPSGPWKTIEGGVCAPKGFKAAAFKAKLRASGKNQADCCSSSPINRPSSEESSPRTE